MLKIQGKEVKLTNQTKIYWPDEGITKGDLIHYYDKMSKYILPYLKDRPESLNRFPNGIKGSSFYHKDAGDTAPDWVSSIKVFSESNQKISITLFAMIKQRFCTLLISVALK
ncbi:non-homologous end-joining DNA ligase LigD [Niabella ginsengisoli]|uniref:DNA ligase D polymerase domain-containing protein n=1 Tax=Niabella ginsengisoli TaxID=522298 RepID=A0ABS9SEQ9_9BACT|nr:hypothetical protein [Niabella ginsengisoli]MCH5596843.1 hypothetical protein [Niabella ginsengisoli]